MFYKKNNPCCSIKIIAGRSPGQIWRYSDFKYKICASINRASCSTQRQTTAQLLSAKQTVSCCKQNVMLGACCLIQSRGRSASFRSAIFLFKAPHLGKRNSMFIDKWLKFNPRHFITLKDRRTFLSSASYVECFALQVREVRRKKP